MSGTSYDVRFWAIEVRVRGQVRYRVVWLVASRRHSKSFTRRALADSFRAELVAAAGKGEAFDVTSGLPVSQLRALAGDNVVSALAHAREFTEWAWDSVAAKSRVSILETLVCVLPVVVRDLPGAPDPQVLRLALRVHLNPGGHAGELDRAQARAVAWLERASLPVSSFADEAMLCDVLDALAAKLDGSRAAPEYFSRRRRVLHRVLGYAVRCKRLAVNPLSKGNLPQSWTPPEAPDDAIDPRCVGSPAAMAEFLVACSYVGRGQGPRFVAFFGCMYYAMMRPSEVAALTEDDCDLPETGWGELSVSGASSAAGRAFTDTGEVHEHRGLKGRDRGQPSTSPRSRRPVRQVPIPPELVAQLRGHIARYGTGAGGRVFRSVTGKPIQPSTWFRVWCKARDLALTPAQRRTALLERPYDARHSGVTWRLSAGVPPPEIAAWAGHSVEVLMRIYAGCMTGMRPVWIAMMDQTLHREDGEDGTR
ncbi:MAG: tyrosine-type recombinase/integrase [Streptosporangiaceae bacterium]